MSSAPVFTVTYWGATGTLSAPLKPHEVTAKFAAALRHLRERDLLRELVSLDPARVPEFLESHLPLHLRATYGGNTTCLEVRTPDALIILDCGSGFRELGMELVRRWRDPACQGDRTAHVIVTHPHMDHTFGTPYFDPYYDPRNQFILYGSASVLRSFDAVLSANSPLSNMYFPPTFDLLKAICRRQTIEGGQHFTIGATKISTMDLRHPGGCLGFRLEHSGKSFVFCTDHEHAEVPDAKLATFAHDADLLYMDGQYLEDEYQGKVGIMAEPAMPRRGWGHSSVESCVATAAAARARRLHIGHREPKRDDFDLARVEAYLQQCAAAAVRGAGRDMPACIPYEGLTVQF
jgi:phosphoribosyl 1,2-cyclic phosphodiesterase